MTIFLVFLALLLLGGAVSLTMLSFRTRNQAFSIGAVVSGLLALFFLFLSTSLVSVAPNERILVLNKVSGNLQEPRGPGYVFVNPITESYTTYEISRQSYTMSEIRNEGNMLGDDAVQARTRDSQEISVDLSLIYSFDPANLAIVRQDWPNDSYLDGLVRPIMRDAVRDVIGNYSAAEITPKREEISAGILAQVKEKMEIKRDSSPTGFLVHEVLLRNVTFSEQYNAAIEDAQAAEMRIQREQNNVLVAEEEAQQVVARAEGAASARLIEAQAEAEALEIIAAVLRENPQLLEYTYVQNLTDQVTVLALPANSPFIFDLQSYLSEVPEPEPAGE